MKNGFIKTLFGGKKNKVVTRFAPSPTGFLHAGNYRTAVFSYLFARKNNGQFILRIEDTDRERSKKEYEKDILDSLDWLGLEYDTMYRQSDRVETHKKYLEQLIKKGKAYVSKEAVTDGEEKEGKRSEVIRFKNPNKKVKFHDLIRGDIEFDTTELGDFVIAKSMDEPLFHLAVVVDDMLSGITHVVRGEDHISNTPRQLLILEAIGGKAPEYAHLPLVLAEDRSKLSKRKGALSITEYRKRGFLPEALLNFMALVGWNPGGNQEIFNKEDLIKLFSLERVQKSSAIFNEEKLLFINKEHIKLLPLENKIKELSKHITDSKRFVNYNERILLSLVPIVFERISTLNEIDQMIEGGDFDYYFNDPEYDVSKLIWKNENDFKKMKGHLLYVRSVLKTLTEEPTAETVKEALWSYAEEKGRGSVLWPLRFALSGRDKSPDPFTLISILGIAESVKRIDNAIYKIDQKI